MIYTHQKRRVKTHLNYFLYTNIAGSNELKLTHTLWLLMYTIILRQSRLSVLCKVTTAGKVKTHFNIQPIRVPNDHCEHRSPLQTFGKAVSDFFRGLVFFFQTDSPHLFVISLKKSKPNMFTKAPPVTCGKSYFWRLVYNPYSSLFIFVLKQYDWYIPTI